MSESAVDRKAVHEEMERARTAFHQLLDHATETDLRRLTDGTRWTNEQLLFHMLFGYILIRPLLVLLRIFGRLPPGAGRISARLLNAAAKLFDVVNHLGPVGGAKVLGRRRTGTAFDRVIADLHRRLDAERWGSRGRRPPGSRRSRFHAPQGSAIAAVQTPWDGRTPGSWS
ncbi:DinB family protein [Streptomyces sp. NPDC058086]|uniref:DinB family protein n=1 Tax=Streptomyces sp. NPDC058086 TaxID=3346334 RepID=UPI0036ED666E